MITYTDFFNSIPLLIIAGTALAIMLLDISFPKSSKATSENVIFGVAMASIVAAIGFTFTDISKNLLLYNNFIRVNTTTEIINVILLIGIFITVLASRNYLRFAGIGFGEYYALLFFALTGMMLMSLANDLVIVFVGLELMSVCFYILAGFMRKKMESNESALKYFLLGAFLTGFLLLGIAFIYGFTGSTNYSVIAQMKPGRESFFLIGMILVFVAFVFKTGSFPLQMWIPDVYQGAPTIVTGMMSSVGKTAAFGAMITFFTVFDLKSIPLIISVIAILTMLYGNVVALAQTNIKRLLAYSSIAHAGYIMVGFININLGSAQAILFYLVSYILMQLGAFIIIGIVEEKPEWSANPELLNTLEGFKGLGKLNPGIASLLTIFLFSLAGIPPFAGFWGKYYIFLSAIQANYVWVAIIGILLSLIGVYYYIKVILYIWFYEPVIETAKVRSNFSFAAAIISVIGLFAFGLYPEFVLHYIRAIAGQ